MAWTLSGSREKMLHGIARRGDEHEVSIKTKPSKKIFLHLLDRTRVKKIIMSHGIARTVPHSVFKGLRHAGVEVKIIRLHAGRPRVHDDAKREKLLSAAAKGMPLDAALKKFGVSRRSYFYWKRKK